MRPIVTQVDERISMFRFKRIVEAKVGCGAVSSVVLPRWSMRCSSARTKACLRSDAARWSQS